MAAEVTQKPGNSGTEQNLLLAKPLRAADAASGYALFLGREPENENALEVKTDLTRGELIRQFLSSGEFDDRVVRVIIKEGIPSGALFDAPPQPALLSWAARFLPLSLQSQERLPRETSWLGALAVMFSDVEFRASLPGFETLFSPSIFAERLHALAQRMGGRSPVGEIDEAGDIVVRGWALDRGSSLLPVGVELWIDGQFIAATLADEFRRDLQDRFQSEGNHGFTFQGFAAPDPRNERSIRIEVRESASKVLIGAKTVGWRSQNEASQIATLSREVEHARDTLNSIEAQLKRMMGAFGYTIANYAEYWRNYYVRTPLQIEDERRQQQDFARKVIITVAVARSPGAPHWLLETLTSLQKQSYRAFDVCLIGAEGESLQLDELSGIQMASGIEASALAEDGYTLVIDAGDLLAPDALHYYAWYVDTQSPTLIFSDCDHARSGGDGRAVFRDPVLRSVCDRDLALQTPCFGETVVIANYALKRALCEGASMLSEHRADLLLHILEGASDEQVVHLPRILYHRLERPEDTPLDYKAAVSASLSRLQAEAVVSSPPPLLGGAASEVRVLWPLRKGLRAAVIVPSKDRLDLLGPCVASLLAAKAANAVELEVVVVDNASTLAATQRFLNALDLSGQIRLIEYDAPFNWSAINNHAARLVDADVLIFLNNDTVVLSQNWADELCRQAMRPEIGAVGARLLYEDGTVQHAGIIINEGMVSHEGAGAPGSDPGYLSRRHLVHQCAAVTGACMATRADLFKAVGGFDEDRLAVEANDIDYCLRLRRSGLRVIYNPYCTLYHFESKSRGQTGSDAMRRSRAEKELGHLHQRWGADLGGDPYYNGHFDPAAKPFTRLGAPPALSPSH